MRGSPVDDDQRRKEGRRLRRRIGTNRQLLKVVRKEMVRLHERSLRTGRSEDHGDDDGSGHESSAGSSSAPDDDPDAGAARARDENDAGAGVIHEDPRPSFGDEVGDDVGGNEWGSMSAAGQVSAAGPAVARARREERVPKDWVRLPEQ